MARRRIKTSTPRPDIVSIDPWTRAKVKETPYFLKKAAFIAIRPAELGTASEMNLMADCRITTGRSGIG